MHCKRKTTRFRGFYRKKILELIIVKNRILLEANFKYLIIHNPSLG